MAAKIKFGFLDYWRLFKRYGIKIFTKYFFDAHLFDIVHGTDTHVWLPRTLQTNLNENHVHGTSYQASWTSEIKFAFEHVKLLTSSNFEEHTFIDVGCGKGKVVLVWQMLLNSSKTQQKVLGIDYDQSLISVAKDNQKKLFKSSEDMFFYCDATKFDYSSLGDKLILYMANPFDKDLLKIFLKRIEDKKIILIYNNPLSIDLLLELGFKKVHEKTSTFHPCCNTTILTKC